MAATKPVPGYPNLFYAGAALDPSQESLSPTLLERLETLAEGFRTQLYIYSGYRSPAYSAAHGGFATDPHTKHIAADVYTQSGAAIGPVYGASTLERYGLRSGNVPNFYKGAPDPSHVDLVGVDGSTNTNVGGMTPAQRVEFIAQGAWRRGLDPGAVLADVTGEGGFTPGSPGDSGTSFGPFQLHAGGALPSNVKDPQTWAWSPAGMNYALDRIKGVAYGLTGQEAITAIVTKFERPADPQSEITGDIQRYNQASLASALPPAPHPELASYDPTGVLPHDWRPWKREFWFPSTGAVPRVVQGAGDAITSGAKLAEAALWPFQHPMRAGQVIAGAILVLVGTYLLAKAVGIDVPAVIPIPV